MLHDGAPNGERITQGVHVPVFDEIMLVAPSDLATLSVTVTASTADDLDALQATFAGYDFGAEALSSGVTLCKCCSEGSRTVERATDSGRQTMFVAAPERRAAELLDQWRSARPEHRGWEARHPAT